MTGPYGAEHHEPRQQLRRALIGIAVALVVGAVWIAAIVSVMNRG